MGIHQQRVDLEAGKHYVNHCSAVLGSDIYVIGGFNQAGNSLNDVQKSTGAQTWMPVAQTKFPGRGQFGLATVNSSLYVIGGFKDRSTFYNDVWKSTDKGVTWKNVHAAP